MYVCMAVINERAASEWLPVSSYQILQAQEANNCFHMPPSQSSTSLASQSTSKIKIPQIFLEEGGCVGGWAVMLHSCWNLSGPNESVLVTANTVQPVKRAWGTDKTLAASVALIKFITVKYPRAQNHSQLPELQSTALPVAHSQLTTNKSALKIRDSCRLLQHLHVWALTDLLLFSDTVESGLMDSFLP